MAGFPSRDSCSACYLMYCASEVCYGLGVLEFWRVFEIWSVRSVRGSIFGCVMVLGSLWIFMGLVCVDLENGVFVYL